MLASLLLFPPADIEEALDALARRHLISKWEEKLPLLNKYIRRFVFHTNSFPPLPLERREPEGVVGDPTSSSSNSSVDPKQGDGGDCIRSMNDLTEVQELPTVFLLRLLAAWNRAVSSCG